jgi:hypothetical protein
VVATNGEFGPSTIIGGLNVSPDGRTAYFATFRTANNKPVWTSWQLRTFDLATGQTRLVSNIRGHRGRPCRRHVRPDRQLHPGRVHHPQRADHQAGPARPRDRQGAQLNASWAVNPAMAG